MRLLLLGAVVAGVVSWAGVQLALHTAYQYAGLLQGLVVHG